MDNGIFEPDPHAWLVFRLTSDTAYAEDLLIAIRKERIRAIRVLKENTAHYQKQFPPSLLGFKVDGYEIRFEFNHAEIISIYSTLGCEMTAADSNQKFISHRELLAAINETNAEDCFPEVNNVLLLVREDGVTIEVESGDFLYWAAIDSDWAMARLIEKNE